MSDDKLIAEIDQTIKAWRSTTSGTDWKTYLPVRLTLLKRARDRLAAMDGDGESNNRQGHNARKLAKFNPQ